MKTKLQKLGLVMILLMIGVMGTVNAGIDTIGVAKVVRNDSVFVKVYMKFYVMPSYDYDSMYVNVGNQQGASDVLKIQGKFTGSNVNGCNKGGVDFGLFGKYCLQMKPDTIPPDNYTLDKWVGTFEIPVGTALPNQVATVFMKMLGSSAYTPQEYYALEVSTNVVEYPNNINSVYKNGDDIKITFGETASSAIVSLYDVSGRLISSETFSGVQQGATHSITSNFNQGLTIVTIQTQQNMSRCVVY